MPLELKGSWPSSVLSPPICYCLSDIILSQENEAKLMQTCCSLFFGLQCCAGNLICTEVFIQVLPTFLCFYLWNLCSSTTVTSSPSVTPLSYNLTESPVPHAFLALMIECFTFKSYLWPCLFPHWRKDCCIPLSGLCCFLSFSFLLIFFNEVWYLTS